MAKDLKEHLKGRKVKDFKAVPHYFANGDYVTYYLRNDRCHAQRVDDLLTVYLAMGTDELVGCKIKGVKHILQTAGDFGVRVDDGDVHLGLFFFLGAAWTKDEAKKKRYEELGRMAKNVSLNREELQPA